MRPIGRVGAAGPIPAFHTWLTSLIVPGATAVIRPLVSLLLSAAIFMPVSAPRPADAAAEVTPEPAPAVELIVLEARGCPMCQLFRDEIAPLYRASARARQVPLRFVDVAHTDIDALGLAAPVEVIPTVIVMRDGVEIDRLVGYTGPEIFMRAVRLMLGESP